MTTTTLARHASSATFVSSVGVFPIERITLAMLRALDSVNDYGYIRTDTATFNRLQALGLAERAGLNDRITHSGWGVLDLFPLPEVYDPAQRPVPAHKTVTWQVSYETHWRPNPRQRNEFRQDPSSMWKCSCGAMGGGHDRVAARHRARRHRISNGAV